MERYSLDDLRLFAAVGRRQSFVRAAAELRVPPSTLSRRLAALEAALGARLVQRTSRRVALTHEGELLLEKAGPLLEELTRVADTAAAAEAPRGTVRVTAPVVSGAEWVAPALFRLARQYADLRIELRLTNEVVNLLDARIDVAVRAGPLASSQLVARRLRTVTYSWFAAPSFVERRLAGATRLTAAQLAKLPAIFMREQRVWRLRTAAGRPREIAPPPCFIVNDPRVALAAAVEGLGIVVAADEMAARHGPALVRLRCTGHALEPRSLFVVTPARTAVPLRTRIVVDALLAERAR